MNMHTTIPPADTAAAIWADACGDRAAIVRNPQRFIRLAELLIRFERDDMERAVDLLLAILDARDGDADLNDGSQAELTGERCEAYDDHLNNAPPVPLADGMAGDPADAENAWYEWLTRGRHKVALGRHEPIDRIGREDDEEDDDGGGAADDLGELAAWRENVDQASLGDWQHEDAEDPLGAGELDEAENGCCAIHGLDQTRRMGCELAAADTLFASNEARKGRGLRPPLTRRYCKTSK